MRLWKVGELAKQTGLTVRALHHYDEIGLLTPSRRSASGYRLYGGDDIARLLQILSLRQLGFSLDEIRDSLAKPGLSLPRVLELHIARLRDGIELQSKLCSRLEAVAERLRSPEAVSVEEFLETMEAMMDAKAMFEKYYTQEQLQQLEERRKMLGEEHIRQVEQEWPRLIAQVREEMAKGTDPASETMQRLSKRWMELVQEFTGGDPGITQSLKNLYQGEPSVQQRNGLDPGIFAYVQQAVAASRKTE
ncbi:MAG TPA: MerR family transcriptional regulator [Thermoanaerobaculia bacterium]|nr:MerR family transcriptional regulator [Thermoanaerobaculia bacterium]